MKAVRVLPRLLLGALMLVTLSFAGSCGKLKGYTPTAEVKSTLVRRSADYLGFILLGDQTRLEGMVLWVDFLGDGEKHLDKTSYFQQVQQAKSLWPDDASNPLLQLDLRSIDVSEDEAEVILRKINSPSSPEIRLFFRWTGSGWMIADDSLFGTDGLIGKTIAAKKDSPNETADG
mgnify:CR=1 FL=1